MFITQCRRELSSEGLYRGSAPHSDARYRFKIFLVSRSAWRGCLRSFSANFRASSSSARPERRDWRARTRRLAAGGDAISGEDQLLGTQQTQCRAAKPPRSHHHQNQADIDVRLCHKCVIPEMSTISQSVASVAPHPIAGPLTAAITGIGTSMKLWDCGGANSPARCARNRHRPMFSRNAGSRLQH